MLIKRWNWISEYTLAAKMSNNNGYALLASEEEDDDINQSPIKTTEFWFTDSGSVWYLFRPVYQSTGVQHKLQNPDLLIYQFRPVHQSAIVQHKQQSSDLLILYQSYLSSDLPNLQQFARLSSTNNGILIDILTNSKKLKLNQFLWSKNDFDRGKFESITK